MRSTTVSKPTPFGLTLRIAAAAAAVMLAGCGNLWLGEREEILPGERIALRATADAEAATPQGTAALPPARPVEAWPQVGGAATRVLGRVDGALAMERDWSTSIGSGSDRESRVTAEPIFANGRVFALDAAARVSAVDAESGDVVWRTDLTPDGDSGRDGFGGGLAAAGDTIVATTGFGEMVGLAAADGSVLWTSRSSAPFRAAPAIANGLAVAGARDGELIAVDVATGETRWRVGNFEAGAAMLGGAGPAIAGEVVTAPFSSGDIAIFRLSDGRRGWSETLGAPPRGSAMALISDVSAAPVMAGSQIIAGGVSGRLVSFDIPSGRRIWARDIGVYSRAWPAGDVVFVVGDDARLYALSLRTGASIWERQLPRYEDPEDRRGPFAYGGPILVGDALYLTSSDGAIFEVDAARGEIKREIDTGDPSSISPIAVGGRLFVVDEDGNLTAYR